MPIKDNETAFVYDTYQELKSDFDKVRECPGMYISSIGSAGAFHLFKEIFNNALDECANELSPGDTITIEYYPQLKQFTVSDNGRGIPFNEMVKSCSQLHTSTKYKNNRKYNLYSAGCNGVGLVVTTAMSMFMQMKSAIKYADGTTKEKTITFNDCVLDEGKIKTSKKNDHGTTVSFIPSEKYLGEIDIDSDDVITWLRHMSYILPPNITCKYQAYTDGTEIPHTRTYTAVGLAENVRFLSPKLEFEPMTFEFTKMVEGDHKQLEFSFSYDKTTNETIIDSYCNYVITSDGGYHEEACVNALCDFMIKAARKADPDAKYEVIRADCKAGLIAAVNLRAESVILGGQHKSKVESKEVAEEGKIGIIDALTDFFSRNQTLLNKIIAFLRQTAKVRIESNKLKGIKPPKPMSQLEEADIATYCPISERNKKGYAELIITEGKSASGPIKKVLNSYHQALYTTGGVLTNVVDMNFHTILKKKVPSELTKIIGCGIGPQFNINNLRWNKIIFMQDADPDGGFIKSLTSMYVLVTMPELVADGRIYSAAPPLYSLTDKTVKKFNLDKDYVLNKKEYFTLRNSIIANNVAFADTPMEDPLPDSVFMRWLEQNKSYSEALDKLRKHISGDVEIVEHACWAIIMYAALPEQERLKKYTEYFKKQFPEMTFDKTTKALYGSINGRHASVIIDDVFIHAASAFLPIMAQNRDIFVKYKNKTEDKTFKIATINEFFNDILGKYALEVKKRYKGLGETDDTLLFLTAVNPKTRRLTRLTMEDRERAIAQMRVLHVDQLVEDRRQLLLNASIDDDDIDT